MKTITDDAATAALRSNIERVLYRPAEHQLANERRADLGEIALWIAELDRQDPITAAADLIAHLAHFAHRAGFDIQAAVEAGLNGAVGDLEDGPEAARDTSCFPVSADQRLKWNRMKLLTHMSSAKDLSDNLVDSGDPVGAEAARPHCDGSDETGQPPALVASSLKTYLDEGRLADLRATLRALSSEHIVAVKDASLRNERRADLAEIALWPDQDPRDAGASVCNLLANLVHFCRRAGIDWDTCVCIAPEMADLDLDDAPDVARDLNAYPEPDLTRLEEVRKLAARKRVKAADAQPAL